MSTHQTEEVLLQRLSKLWFRTGPEYLSTKQIVWELRLTPAKLKRLIRIAGLPRRPSPIKRESPPKVKKIRSAGPVTLPLLPEPVSYRPARIPPAESCQWVIGDDRPFRFCGLGTIRGQSYCEHHYPLTHISGSRSVPREPQVYNGPRPLTVRK